MFKRKVTRQCAICQKTLQVRIGWLESDSLKVYLCSDACAAQSEARREAAWQEIVKSSRRYHRPEYIPQ